MLQSLNNFSCLLMEGWLEYSYILHSYLSWVDTLNLWLHFVEVDKGCLHIIKLKQTGNKTHLLTCECDHNHMILL